MTYYKHPMYGHVYGEAQPTPLARVVWPSLVSPKAPPPPQPGQEAGQPRYEVTLVLPKTREIKAWLDALSVMAQEMLLEFNKGRKSKLTTETAEPESLVKDGDSFDQEKYPYYKEAFILTARNVKLPPIINREGEDMQPNAILGGMLVKAVITPLITAHGVSYKLNALKLVEDDGIRFGGGIAGRNYVDMLSGDSPDEGETTPEEPEEVQEVEEAEDVNGDVEEEKETPKKTVKVRTNGVATKTKGSGKGMALKML